jgi:GNAT superfamily N-acetyltransferase
MHGAHRMLRIERLSRDDPDFYRLMGPFFGSRSLAAEVGIHPYDDADKIWITAILYQDIVGIMSLRGRTISDCYVLPGHRGNGIFSKMLAHCLASHGGSIATCTSASMPAFLAAGFEIVSKTKNFTRVKRNG